jgi:cation transport regulator ChaC
MVYRIPEQEVPVQLERLWAREMPTGIYDPKWLSCRTAQGRVKALAFTLHRKSPSHTGPVPDAQMVDILRTANGRYGSTPALLDGDRGVVEGLRHPRPRRRASGRPRPPSRPHNVSRLAA